MSTRLASAFALVLASNCTTAPQPQHEPEVVGAWLPIARGPAVLVAARLDDLLGDPPRAWHEPPRTSRRAEVDVGADFSPRNSVPCRGSLTAECANKTCRATKRDGLSSSMPGRLRKNVI
jgi:hypothetical protein